MRKQFAIGSVIALAFGVAACTPPAENEGDNAAEEAMEEVEETGAEADAAMDGEMMDGEMTQEASVAEGEGDVSTGVDQDGNPVHD